MSRPEGTRGQLRLCVGGAIVADLAGGRGGGSFLPFPQESKRRRWTGRIRSKPARSKGGRVDVGGAASRRGINSRGRRAGLRRLAVRQVDSKVASQVLKFSASCCQAARAFCLRNCGA